MTWIYLSPHFDDAVLSGGGLIYTQSRTQKVEIWTVCAGEIPPGPLTPFAGELHARWGTGLAAVPVRQAEDEAACRAAGAAWRWFDLPDCIYRRLSDGQPLVQVNDDLWLPYLPAEEPLVERIRAWLAQNLADLPAGARLVSPLALGGHRDHRLARAAAERLGRPLWYYADYPYVEKEAFEPGRLLGPGWRVHSRRLSPAALAAWQAAVAAHASQLSTFWPGLAEMRAAIAAYSQTRPGRSLWGRVGALSG